MERSSTDGNDPENAAGNLLLDFALWIKCMIPNCLAAVRQRSSSSM
jgi:hypothetical protein